jgi:uncharacterized protein (TIGR02466 family)
MKENQHNIFSTPIWGFVLNDQKYQSIDYIEAIKTIEKTEPSVKRSNFGGYQTHDNLHQVPVFKEFTSTLIHIAQKCLDRQVKITEMWGNINYKNCYNGAHTHGGELSGVFYLKVPKNSGKLILCNPAVRSDGKFLRANNFAVEPDSLALIMFPSWLEHYVDPNLSEEERISLSFNFSIL